MSNKIRRDLGRVALSPASFCRFLRQDPRTAAFKLAHGTCAAAVILSAAGYLYWLPDFSYNAYENVKARRERRESITADLEKLEREIDSIRGKLFHSRVQKEDTKTKADPGCRAG